MQCGAVFPQTEIGTNPVAIRCSAQAAENPGHSHLLDYDHPLGTRSEHRSNRQGTHDRRAQFHELFVLFCFLAGIAQRSQPVTRMTILPCRQTVEIENGGPDNRARTVEAWQQLGATHLGINTMSVGLDSPVKHMDAIPGFKEALGGLAVAA